MNATSLPRRRFLARSLAAVATSWAIPWLVPARALGAADKAPANSRINIGMIGLGRQAYFANLPPFLFSPDTQVVALCDVDAWRLDIARKKVEEHYAVNQPGGSYKGCKIYRHFREVLACQDVDAVMISTPDHWHVLMAVEAAKAGKDVALEKPVSLSVAQGRALADAIKKHSRVCRTDTEVRTEKLFCRAVELARNGRLGQLRKIFVGVPKESPILGRAPRLSPAPEELDFDLWLGPAPVLPYSEDRVHPRQTGVGAKPARPGWMQLQDYTDGMILNWGAHLIDIAQWGNNTERSGPVEVEGQGVFPKDAYNVLQDFDVHCRYASGVELRYTMAGRPYVRFEGAEGWVEAQWWKDLQAEPKSLLDWKPGPGDLTFKPLSEKADFIDCIKSRREPQIPAEIGHRTASLCQLAVIAIKTGRKLRWDPVAEQLLNDAEASRMLTRPMRGPWRLAPA
jgi:myo-inositol 2-dehydrogenase / D-chiro-inositol 1-dehydrogenase